MMNNIGILKTAFSAPLHSWDIFSMFLKSAGEGQTELENLIEYQKRFDWNIDLDEVLNQTYEALVLTDASVRIQWVSDGFADMTGYSGNEVIGKSPEILQGANTTKSSRERVRQKLFGLEPFTEDLVNYRKSGEEYICRVTIYPIFNVANDLCHFLALEREV